MKIERKKVEKASEFSPRTKARLAALLGVSAAFSISACASAQQKEDVSQKHDSDGAAEILGENIAVSPYKIPLSSRTLESSSSVSSSSSSDTTDIQNIPESTRWLFDPKATAGILLEDDKIEGFYELLDYLNTLKLTSSEEEKILDAVNKLEDDLQAYELLDSLKRVYH